MKGMYNVKLPYPYTPGWEGAGTVVEVGGGQTAQWFLNKRVAFMKAHEIGSYKIGGSFAEYAITNIKQVMPLSDDTSLEEGAAYFVNPLTALGMVKRAKELGATAIILTAGASQIGRMIIRLCEKYGITPIITVRREVQAEMLRKDFGCKYVVNTSLNGYEKTLGKACQKLRPSVCLECIAGDVTGDMLKYMGFGSRLILYGLLSEKPASNIDVIGLIGKSQYIEPFLLTNVLGPMTLLEYIQYVLEAEPLLKEILTTTVNARFGLHQITEAIEFYKANQTAGKILLQPALTPALHPATAPAKL